MRPQGPASVRPRNWQAIAIVYVTTGEIPMAWIKRKIEASGDDNADLVSGGIFVIATVATFAALYSLGM
jgi:hypothetical protein